MFILKIRKSPLVYQPLLHLVKDIIQDRLQGRRLCSFWAPKWGSSRRELLQLYFMVLVCLQCTGNPCGESRSTQLSGAKNTPHFGKLHWRSRTPSLDFHDKKVWSHWWQKSVGKTAVQSWSCWLIWRWCWLDWQNRIRSTSYRLETNHCS